MKNTTIRTLISSLLLVLTACSSGGGGNGNTGTNPDVTNPNGDNDSDGFINSVDVDNDNNGLIEIGTLAQLDWMRNDLAGTSLTDHMMNTDSTGCPVSGCNGYELVVNLDFDTNGDGVMDANDTYYDYDGDGSNKGWLRVGDSTTPFTGNFNGNGLGILNLYIDRPGTDAVGLFGTIDGGTSALTINNLVLEGPLMQIMGRWGAAGLSGTAVSATITNVHSSGSITGTQSAALLVASITSTTVNNCTGSGSAESDFYTAGLISQVSGSSTINDSSSDANVTNGASTTGGLVASLDASTINNSFFSGQVTGNVNLTGGLVGNMAGTGALISNSYSTGQVNGSNDFTGGLVGGTSRLGSTITNSYATGDVTGENSVGGLLGGVRETGSSNYFEIHNSYATGNVTGNNSVGGLVGQSTGLILTRSFATGDVMGNVNYVGGLVGLTYDTTITDAFATGNVNATGRYAGGLVGDANLSTNMTNNLSTGGVSGSEDVGGLVGWSDNATYTDNYFVNDKGVVNAIGTNFSGGGTNPPGTLGASQIQLKCPVTPDDTTCAPGFTLYSNWDTANWDFGTDMQFPGLIIDSTVYRDGDGDGELD